MSFKNKLTAVQVIISQISRQKQIVNINANIKTYQIEIQSLRQTKQAFEKAFNSKNTDIKRSVTTQLERIHQQLNQNSRIQLQLAQLNQQKQNYQGFLRNIREKLEDIERQIGQ